MGCMSKVRLRKGSFWMLFLSGPVLRAAARLPHWYPRIAQYAVLGVSIWEDWIRYSPPPSKRTWGANLLCAKGVSQRYLRHTPIRRMRHSLCDTILRRYCTIWRGISPWAAKRLSGRVWFSQVRLLSRNASMGPPLDSINHRFLLVPLVNPLVFTMSEPTRKCLDELHVAGMLTSLRGCFNFYHQTPSIEQSRCHVILASVKLQRTVFVTHLENHDAVWASCQSGSTQVRIVPISSGFWLLMSAFIFLFLVVALACRPLSMQNVEFVSLQRANGRGRFRRQTAGGVINLVALNRQLCAQDHFSTPNPQVHRFYSPNLGQKEKALLRIPDSLY